MSSDLIIKIIITIVNSIITTSFLVYAGSVIFEDSKINIKSIGSVVPYVIYAIFVSSTDFIMDRFLKTIVSFIAITVLCKIIHKNDWYKTILSSLIMYLTLLISEVIYCGVLFIPMILKANSIVNFLAMTVTANIFVFGLACLMIKIFKKQIKSLIKNMEKHSDAGSIVLFIGLLVVLTILLTRIDLRKNLLKYDFFINISICAIILAISFFLLKQKFSYKAFLNKYKQITNYTDLHDVILEEYRIRNHEYKNQLAIIKSLADSENKELIEYVDNLIEMNKEVKFSWINQINYLNLAGLKGLINHKITEFNELKVKTSITISKELQKWNFENLNVKDKDNLYTIIGVYLDNAKEAAIESEDKQVMIDISIDKENVCVVISNTYKNNFDSEKLDNYRYSTKGKERGIGLYLVQKIINKNSKFKIERNITEKYYTQKLYIAK